MQDGGDWCLVLELCSRGTFDMLIHHHRSPLPRPPSPKPRPQTEALIAAGIVNAPQQPKHAALTRPDVVKLLVLMRGVARGLLHLHTRSPAILHRDIKPANILIGSGMQVRGRVLLLQVQSPTLWLRDSLRGDHQRAKLWLTCM